MPTDLLESEKTDAAARPTRETVPTTPVRDDVISRDEKRVDTGTVRPSEEGSRTGRPGTPAPTDRSTEQGKPRKPRKTPREDEYSPEYAHDVFLEQAQRTDPDVNPADYPTTSLDRALKLARRASSPATSFSIVVNAA